MKNKQKWTFEATHWQNILAKHVIRLIFCSESTYHVICTLIIIPHDYLHSDACRYIKSTILVTLWCLQVYEIHFTGGLGRQGSNAYPDTNLCPTGGFMWRALIPCPVVFLKMPLKLSNKVFIQLLLQKQCVPLGCHISKFPWNNAVRLP